MFFNGNEGREVPTCFARSPENDGQEFSQLVQVGEIEQSPAHHRSEQQVKVREKFRDGVQDLLKEQSFERDEYPEIQSPENKVPAWPVPQPGKEPDDKQVPVKVGAVAAKRYIKVVAEEKRGLFGMEGAKPAKIIVTLKENE